MLQHCVKSVLLIRHTPQNAVISPRFLVKKFSWKAQLSQSFRWNCTFPQNFHTRKSCEITVFYAVLANVFLFKCSNRTNGKRYEICSKLTRHQNDVIDIVLASLNFECISHVSLTFLLLTLNKYKFSGYWKFKSNSW